MDSLVQYYSECSQCYGLSPSVTYGWESWTIYRMWMPKKWCFQIAMLEKTLEVTLDIKEIKPVSPRGKQPWIFIGKTDAEAEVPILWPTNARSQLIGQDLDAGKDWGQEEKGATEDEMAGWHHRLDGHEFEPTSGDSEGQGSLLCCSPWGCKESDTIYQLSNNNGQCYNVTHQNQNLQGS